MWLSDFSILYTGQQTNLHTACCIVSAAEPREEWVQPNGFSLAVSPLTSRLPVRNYPGHKNPASYAGYILEKNHLQ